MVNHLPINMTTQCNVEVRSSQYNSNKLSRELSPLDMKMSN